MSAARLTFVFMVWADTLSGQSAQISGVIRDPSDLGIKDAQVGILNEQAGGRRNARSNESGSYSLPSLNPGRYRVTVRALGFETTMQEGVKLEVGESAQIDFTMHLGDPHSVLTVRADAHSMNTESAAVGTVIDRNTIDQMPLNGRGIQSLIELSPGVAPIPVRLTTVRLHSRSHRLPALSLAPPQVEGQDSCRALTISLTASARIN